MAEASRPTDPGVQPGLPEKGRLGLDRVVETPEQRDPDQGGLQAESPRVLTGVRTRTPGTRRKRKGQ